MIGSESALVRAQDLGKSFQQRSIFSHLSFAVKKHEFVSLLGSSGCGKSTLLRMIGGLERPTQGSLQKSLGQKQSFVFQEPRLLNWRNVLENTVLPLELQNGQVTAQDQIRARHVLHLLHLQDAAGLFPQELSGGMKMRAAIARSLMLSPDLLLLDEPFSALDEGTRFFLQQELRKIFELNSWSVLFVTHSLEEALFLSDRILIFDHPGQNLKEYSPPFSQQGRDSKLRDELSFFESLRHLRSLQ